MSLLSSFNNLSFKKLTSMAMLLAIFVAIPVTVYVVQQQTRLDSKAFFEKPKPIVPKKIYGAASEGQPEITLVWPFLGKVGDAVLIHGKNLGNNPIDKTLKVGSQTATEQEINKWTPELIEFTIPQGSSFGPISLSVSGKEASWGFPFTVYDLDTLPQVTENNDVVKALNAPAGATLTIYYNDGSSLESDKMDNTQVASDKTIMSVLVKNSSGQPIPFFVEPTEFGF